MIESFDLSRPLTDPSYTTAPPCSPAPGPMSTTWSDDADRLLVVLDDQHGVAQVAQPHQGLDQPPVVALVQSDRGLVEHVQHADEPAADLGGEPDALRLASGQRAGGTRQRQVVETDVEQEPHPGVDLFDDALGDHSVTFGQAQIFERLGRFADREVTQLGEVATVDRHRQRQRLQPRAAACVARHLAHVALDLLADRVALGFDVAALQIRNNTFVGRRVAPDAPVAIAELDQDPFLAGPVQEDLLLLGGELGPRHVDLHAVLFGHRLDQAAEVLAASATPRRDRALFERQIGVGNDEIGIDLVSGAEPVALLARSVRRVEGEVAGSELFEAAVPVRTGEVLAEREDVVVARFVGVTGDDLDLGNALGQLQCGLERVGESPLDAVSLHQAVDDDLDRVHLVAGEVDLVRQLVQLAVDAGARETLRGEIGQAGSRTFPFGLGPRVRAPGTACPPGARAPGRRSAAASGE